MTIRQEQLPKMLEGRTTPMVTNCMLEELRAQGDRSLGAAIIAKGCPSYAADMAGGNRLDQIGVIFG